MEVQFNENGSSFAYLDIAKAAVITVDSTMEMFTTPEIKPKSIPGSDSPGYVPWGESDDIPQRLIEKVSASVDVSRYMQFNVSCSAGNGVMAVKRTVDVDGKQKFIPVFDNPLINAFFEDNDIDAWYEDQLFDLWMFNICWSEMIMDQNDSATRNIVEMNHMDATFSRWETQNLVSRKIENHFYDAKFSTNESLVAGETVTSPVLDRKKPILDLKRKIGRVPDRFAYVKDEKMFRYVMSSEMSSPGKWYYPRCLWWAIFTSGWYDFAIMIPAFKKALLKNQMTLKYVVYISDQYWMNMFQAEGIVDKDARETRVKLEYKHIQDFLAGVENTGKAIVSGIKYTVNGQEQPYIKITPIENAFKGGEYIEDSVEVSNILAKGMGVHASIVGSNGKTSTIGGTEARELFIITEALMAPIRKRALRPLYVVKAINRWPEDIFFVTPNTELTSLDKGTGAVKQVGGTEL